MLFRCLWRNVETSCRKHFVVVSCHQQVPPLATSDKCHNLPQSGGVVLITPSGRSVTARGGSRYWLRSQFMRTSPALHSTPSLRGGGSPPEYCHGVRYGKTRMVSLPDGGKILKICLFVLTEFTNVTDRQTHTDRHRMTA